MELCKSDTIEDAEASNQVVAGQAHKQRQSPRAMDCIHDHDVKLALVKRRMAVAEAVEASGGRRAGVVAGLG
jgi:hypothetical protein